MYREEQVLFTRFNDEEGNTDDGVCHRRTPGESVIVKSKATTNTMFSCIFIMICSQYIRSNLKGNKRTWEMYRKMLQTTTKTKNVLDQNKQAQSVVVSACEHVFD